MGGARTPIRYRRGMSAESVVRGLVERVWNGGHTEELDQFFASTFDHGGQPDSVAGLREWHTADAATWADGFYQIVALISDGEQVALRWRATARHIGVWGPIAPTGATISWDGVHFFVVRDERIVGLWALSDMFRKALQLGARFES
jgi:predicted ester cyclase